MLRQAFVLLGLAVLLSLLFPVQALLRETGIDPRQVRVAGVDLAVLCAAIALLPAFALCRDARIAQRIPRWNAWMVLLALCSVMFVLLHMHWSRELAASHVLNMLGAEGALGLSHLTLLAGLELAARIGVLVSLVGVLVRLDAVPDDAPVKRRKK